MTQLRKELTEKLERTEEVSLEDLDLVNPFSRREVMEMETRELVSEISECPEPLWQKVHRMLDVYDHLASDWIYSDALEWTDSLPDKQSIKIGKVVHG